jgi:putative membrane protein
MKTLPSFRSTLLSCFAGATAFTFAASASAADVTSADQSFVKNTYQDGLAEIRMGELGQSKSANADVKAFAERMIADHGKANAELKTLADTKGLSLANGPGVMAMANAKMLDMKAGAEFDKAFAAHMVSDHQKTVEAFEKASNDTKDPEIRAFIAKTLPTLKEHLSMAQALQNKVGK